MRCTAKAWAQGDILLCQEVERTDLGAVADGIIMRPCCAQEAKELRVGGERKQK